MKRIIIIVVIVLSNQIFPQYQDSIYTVEVVSSFSPLISFYKNPRYSSAANNATLGYGGTIRVMWFPGRLLAVGIMSGYCFFAEDNVNSVKSLNQSISAKAKLSAIPLMAVVSMQSSNFEFGVGMGTYLMMTSIYYGKTANGKRTELGISPFVSYVFRIKHGIYLGTELGVLYLSYRGILSIMPSLTIHFDAYRY